jgi:prepilin-type N-terminal cleavage/methylation domain-containing protein
MEIKNKIKAFTLIEVLVSMLLLSLIILSSVKAYAYILNSYKISELRYLALNKLDSEMNRLAFAYENLAETDFSANNNDTTGSWRVHFDVPHRVDNEPALKFYTANPLFDAYGLSLSTLAGVPIAGNDVEILDQNDSILNEVDDGDIVGHMAWKVSHFPADAAIKNHNFVYLSLSITYPYIRTTTTSGTHHYEELDSMPVETINLKTAVGYSP